MCNRVHEEHSKIREEGIAYKIFTRVPDPDGKEEFYGLLECYYERRGDSGWVKWNKDYGHDSRKTVYGFCGFATREEAEATRLHWNMTIQCWDTTVKKVEYRKGVARQREDRMILGEPIEILLFKEFKIVEEEE